MKEINLFKLIRIINGIKLSRISRWTKIPLWVLKDFENGLIELNEEDFSELCRFFHLDPHIFLKQEINQNALRVIREKEKRNCESRQN